MNAYEKSTRWVPKVGRWVVPDGWPNGASLQACDDWDQADFRIHTVGGDLAVNVEVTGWTLQYPFGVRGGPYVRVAVTFIADKCQDIYTGEMVGEDVTVRGWMDVGYVASPE